VTMNLELLSKLRDSLPQLEAEQKRRQGNQISKLFPDTGPLRRELYLKHLEFFEAGKVHKERLALAANKVGKILSMGGYVTALHLTGQYPKWWPGRKFAHAIEAWACNTTWADVRDINQLILCGPPTQEELWGTGLIPGNVIEKYIVNAHVKDGLIAVLVKHKSGGLSELQFKTYEAGYKSFLGRNKHVVWLDEEPEEDVYTECLIRTGTTRGIVMATFTPLRGRTKLINSFLTQAANRDKLVLN